MKEIKRQTNLNIDKPITVDDVIRKVIKNSPRMDTKRQDLQRGKYYYLSGGDPDRRNQI